MSGLKMLEDAFAEPREQRRALNLAAEGRLTVWVKKWRVALPVPEDAEAAWEQLERKLGLEPTPNATTAFASSLPAPDGHKTWLLVPPNVCEELACEGTAEVRHLPCADDPEQLAVFSEPLTLTIADLWIDPAEAGKLLNPDLPQGRKPHTALIAHEVQAGAKRGDAWKKLKRLASESKGTEQVELPGHGPVYLKRDRHDPENTVRYKHHKFDHPEDGELVKKGAFDRAWSKTNSSKKDQA